MSRLLSGVRYPINGRNLLRSSECIWIWVIETSVQTIVAFPRDTRDRYIFFLIRGRAKCTLSRGNFLLSGSEISCPLMDERYPWYHTSGWSHDFLLPLTDISLISLCHVDKLSQPQLNLAVTSLNLISGLLTLSLNRQIQTLACYISHSDWPWHMALCEM